ncbi:MAG: DUF116 domain-containing protein [archaeon]
MDLIYIIGYSVWIFFIFAVISISLLAILVAISLRSGRAILPSLMMFLITAFEAPAQALLNFFGVENDSVSKLAVQIRNKLNSKAFAETEYKDRLLLLPQCLRHSTKCPAKTTKNGIQCVQCGNCDISKIMKKANELGYKVAIAPGGAFASRRMKEVRPKAGIGVGCLFELKEGLNTSAKYKIPGLGVELEAPGCVNTKIDLRKLFEVMEAKA